VCNQLRSDILRDILGRLPRVMWFASFVGPTGARYGRQRLQNWSITAVAPWPNLNNSLGL
jgi:hypothetical protein